VDPVALALLRSLLTERRLLSIAVVADGEPIAGVLPFLAAPDLQSLAVHVSRLGRHARGLTAGAPFSAAIHEPDSDGRDPLQVARLVVSGRVERLAGAAEEIVRREWMERFPMAALTLQLGDFEFHRLRIETGRMIVGFARAFGVGPRILADAAAFQAGGASPSGSVNPKS
jgi:hypothetical protein